MAVMTAVRTSPSADRPRPGLRERKKTRTRTAIRDAAYRLIQEQGYDATTVEQIAERAQVSPSTVFRYFPAREDIVLPDEYGPLLVAALRARPADEPWRESLRHVLTKTVGFGTAGGAGDGTADVTAVGTPEEVEVTRLRARLMVEVPAVRLRMAESVSATGRLLRQVIGERTGRTPDGLEVRVFATSLVGGLMEISLYWAEHRDEDDLGTLVDRALDVLAGGVLGSGGPAVGVLEGQLRSTGPARRNPEAAAPARMPS